MYCNLYQYKNDNLFEDFRCGKKCVLNKIKFYINLKNIISLVIIEDYVNNLNN